MARKKLKSTNNNQHKPFFMLNPGSQAPHVSAEKPLTLILITGGTTYLRTSKGQIWLLHMNETRILRPQMLEDTYPMATQGVVISEEQVTFTSLYHALIHCFRFEYHDEYTSNTHWYQRWTADHDYVNAKEAKRYADLYERGMHLLDKLAKETNRGFRKKYEREMMEIVRELEAPLDTNEILNAKQGNELMILGQLMIIG